jgi:hypothetical protein
MSQDPLESGSAKLEVFFPDQTDRFGSLGLD